MLTREEVEKRLAAIPRVGTNADIREREALETARELYERLAQAEREREVYRLALEIAKDERDALLFGVPFVQYTAAEVERVKRLEAENERLRSIIHDAADDLRFEGCPTTADLLLKRAALDEQGGGDG